MEAAAALANSPLGSVTKSFFDAATVNIFTGGYGDAAAYAFLVMALMLHFIFYILENNKGVKRSGTLYVAMAEARVYLQVTIVTQFVYWASFWVGILSARTNDSFYETVMRTSPWISLLTVIFIVNKVCQLLTARANVNPTSKWPLPSLDYKIPLVVGNYTPGMVLDARAVFSDTKNQALYVVTYWLQNVTEIVLANAPSGFMLGYAAGLAFPRL